ncbi:MAG: hypothetical protein ACE5IG_02915 [Dehalococcoidia bacterium]
MATSRKRALEYAERVMDVPKRAVPVTLYHGRSGVTLRHDGRVLTRCYASGAGLVAGVLMAQALGLKLPRVGHSVETEVSTGVLFRAVAISALNPKRPEVRPLLERYLEEAELLRTGRGAEA